MRCVSCVHQICVFVLQKHALMEQVAHQTIVMQFILELAKSLKVDPRGCFRQFFTKIKVCVCISVYFIRESSDSCVFLKTLLTVCVLVLHSSVACVCFQTADQQYQDAFNDELESFKERVRGRAKIRIEKAMKEYEEEERQKRLGPGGVDPVEVYESLPPVKNANCTTQPFQML